MERNDELRRGREREWREGRGERRWERGEVGEAHTGAPEDARSDDYGERRWERERAWRDDEERRDDRREPWYPHADEHAQTWSRTDYRRPWEDDRRRPPEPYQFQPHPTRPYEEPGRAPPHEPTRASQYGYRMGPVVHDRPRDEERSRTWWGPTPRRGRPPRDYRRSDDRIRDEIVERIVRESDVDASDVELQVVTGEVTLIGTVEDRQAKRELEDLVERVFGVTDIHNNVRVRKSAWRQIGERLFGNEGEEPRSEERQNRSQPEERTNPRA